MKHNIYSIIILFILFTPFASTIPYFDTGWWTQHAPATLRRRLGHTTLIPSPPTSLALPEPTIDTGQSTRSDDEEEKVEEACQHPFWKNMDEYGFERDLFDDILVDNQERRRRLADSLA
jgi:hypothetical protein